MSRSLRDGWRRGLRMAVAGLMLASVLVGGSGLGCDGDAAKAFRQTATGPIGDGVKGIVDGILDGAIAAIESAGDGSADSDTDGSSSSDSSSTDSTSSGDSSSSSSS